MVRHLLPEILSLHRLINRDPQRMHHLTNGQPQSIQLGHIDWIFLTLPLSDEQRAETTAAAATHQRVARAVATFAALDDALRYEGVGFNR